MRWTHSLGVLRARPFGHHPRGPHDQNGCTRERGAVRAGEDELGNRLIDDLDRDPDLTAFPEMIG